MHLTWFALCDQSRRHAVVGSPGWAECARQGSVLLYVGKVQPPHSFGKRKLLFDQGRPVRGTRREHRIIEVEGGMVQHGVVFAGAL